MFSMWVSITLIHDLYIYSSTAGKQCPLAKSYSDSKSDNQRGNVLLLWAGIQTQSCQTLMLQDYYILDIFQRGQKGQTWDFHLLSLSCSAFNHSATAPPNVDIFFVSVPSAAAARNRRLRKQPNSLLLQSHRWEFIRQRGSAHGVRHEWLGSHPVSVLIFGCVSLGARKLIPYLEFVFHFL